MWDTLEVAYEEISKVKVARIGALENEYELFKMIDGEKVEIICSLFCKKVS